MVRSSLDVSGQVISFAEMCVCRERTTWRCSHCLVHGSAVWAVRDGPNGPRVGHSPYGWSGAIAKRITVIMQQLRPRVRARQTITTLGEESALWRYPYRAMTQTAVSDTLRFMRIKISER